MSHFQVTETLILSRKGDDSIKDKQVRENLTLSHCYQKMKRSNPFGECCPLQFKIRIGQKEVDMGVGEKENMKVVYEKTKALLFKGSHKSFTDSAPATDANDNMLCEPVARDRPVGEVLPGQLCLDSGCQLMPPQLAAGSGGSSSAVTSSKDAGLTCVMCKSCVTQRSSESCGFCDALTCRSCVRQCHSCVGLFCQLCSVLNYDEAMERAFCLNCS